MTHLLGPSIGSMALSLILLTACAKKEPCPGGVLAEVDGNHGHSVDIPKLAVGTETTLVGIRGGSHEHSLAIPAAKLETLRATGHVELVASSVNGHTHAVTLTCRQ